MEWKPYALLAPGEEAAFFRLDQGEWACEPISGEPWTPARTAQDLARLLDKLSDRVNDARGLEKCEILILYAESVADFLPALAERLKALNCRRWQILRLEPARLRAVAAGRDPGAGWPEAWAAERLLPPLWESLREIDPATVPRPRTDEEALERLSAEKAALEAENRQLRTERDALRLEARRAQQKEARAQDLPFFGAPSGLPVFDWSGSEPDPEALKHFLPAIYRNIWGAIGALEWSRLTGSDAPLGIASPYPEPVGEALEALQDQLRRLPQTAQEQIRRACRRIVYRQNIRPEMWTWLNQRSAA